MTDEHRDLSLSNSKKLDELISWVKGDATNPGFNDRVRLIEKILFGIEGRRGMIQEHIIMWRVHVWLLCGLSTILGSVLTLLIQKVIHVL